MSRVWFEIGFFDCMAMLECSKCGSSTYMASRHGVFICEGCSQTYQITGSADVMEVDDED